MHPFNSLTGTGRIGDRVFQHVRAGLGNVTGDASRTLQNRAYVAHNTSSSSGQLTCRGKFASAVAAWRTLDDASKKTYKDRAQSRAISSFNQYISDFMKG